MKTLITASIDGSMLAGPVCDAAAWASARLQAPLQLLHVLERPMVPVVEDLSGSIGLGSRELLLAELTALDEKRGKLAMEHGRHMLEDAAQRVRNKGVQDVQTAQRHGGVLDTLAEQEAQTRLFVLGRRGEAHAKQANTLGSNLENVVRAMHTPILVATETFVAPQSYLIAFDGSETAQTLIERIAHSPLLRGLSGHLVMVAPDASENHEKLGQARAILDAQGLHIKVHLLQGQVIDVLEDFRAKHDIGLIVMGAYGHSRIREFFVGSHTSRMIRQSPVPLLLLR